MKEYALHLCASQDIWLDGSALVKYMAVCLAYRVVV